MSLHKICACALATWGLAACSPALNWREVRPADSGVVAMFPCKPDRFARSVTLAGKRVQMSLSSCVAAGGTYALMHSDLGDPTNVTAALTELRAAAVDNIGGRATVLSAFTVAGMTPSPLAERLAIEGRKADGTAMREQAGFFTKGTRVYQATIVGDTIDQEAVDTFFGGLQLPG